MWDARNIDRIHDNPSGQTNEVAHEEHGTANDIGDPVAEARDGWALTQEFLFQLRNRLDIPLDGSGEL
jgi:hypothetical protein